MGAPYGVEVSLRVSRRGVLPGVFFGVLGLVFHHFSSIFRVLGTSGATWVRSCIRWTICFNFATISGGFGRVWEGQNDQKIEILVVFGGMLLETLFLVDFCWIFDKNDREKHMDFLLYLALFFVFFLTLETLKIVLLSRRELNFYKIPFFELDEKRRRK